VLFDVGPVERAGPGLPAAAQRPETQLPFQGLAAVPYLLAVPWWIIPGRLTAYPVTSPG